MFPANPFTRPFTRSLAAQYGTREQYLASLGLVDPSQYVVQIPQPLNPPNPDEEQEEFDDGGQQFGGYNPVGAHLPAPPDPSQQFGASYDFQGGGEQAFPHSVVRWRRVMITSPLQFLLLAPQYFDQVMARFQQEAMVNPATTHIQMVLVIPEGYRAGRPAFTVGSKWVPFAAWQDALQTLMNMLGKYQDDPFAVGQNGLVAGQDVSGLTEMQLLIRYVQVPAGGAGGEEEEDGSLLGRLVDQIEQEDLVSSVVKGTKLVVAVARTGDPGYCLGKAVVASLCGFAEAYDRDSSSVKCRGRATPPAALMKLLGVEDPPSFWQQLKHFGKRDWFQTRFGKAIMNLAGIEPVEGMVTVTEADKLQLVGLTPLVISTVHGGRAISLVQFTPGKLSWVIPILFTGDHYHGLRSWGVTHRKYFQCSLCSRRYFNVWEHTNCLPMCVQCGYPGQHTGSTWRERCEKCNLVFHDPICFQLHAQRGKHRKSSQCDKRHVCFGVDHCRPYDPRWYEQHGVRHECGDWFCKSCKGYVRADSPSDPHRCNLVGVYEAGRGAKILPPSWPIIYFDFETIVHPVSHSHEITHAVAMCAWDHKVVQFSSLYDPTIPYDVESRFCEWLMSFNLKRPQGSGYFPLTAIAHNGRAFDFQFILRWALRNGLSPRMVFRDGTKLKYMELEGVRFVDSMAFFGMSLRAMCRSMGVDTGKGWFPHAFHTWENRFYVGAPPAQEYFGADVREPGFQTWYNSLHTYDLQKEIQFYCELDVRALMASCTAFATLFREQTGLCPFYFVSLPAACYAYFKESVPASMDLPLLLNKEERWLRKGFFGGRTQVLQPYCKPGPGMGIFYYDVVSLYPWVNSTCEYPIGRPKFDTDKVTGHDAVVALFTRQVGWFEVEYIPPKDLRHPVLPRRDARTGALLFPVSAPPSPEVHSAWELRVAAQQGYQFLSCFSRLVFPDVCHGVFQDYVKKWMRIKYEASSWPEDITTPEARTQWLNMVQHRDGVSLDPACMQLNPGKRSLAKLCLNSLWGKTAQRHHDSETVFTPEVSRVYGALQQEKVLGLHELSPGFENDADVVYELKLQTPQHPEFQLNYTSLLYLACATTAHARLRLWKALNAVGDAAVYCDTDSIMYLAPLGHECPLDPCGSFLGNWKDELNGGHIEEFVGAGPKLYAYRTNKGKECIKGKGLRLREGCSLTFDDFRSQVASVISQVASCPVNVPTGFELVVDRSSMSIKTRLDGSKRFRATLQNKGVVSSDGTQLMPIGFTESPLPQE